MTSWAPAQTRWRVRLWPSPSFRRPRIPFARTATHYAELKTFAMTTAGVENGSCEFDVPTLRPTYRLSSACPASPTPLPSSRRLGLMSPVIQAAQAQMDSESIRFEDVLTQLEEKRQRLEKAQGEAGPDCGSRARRMPEGTDLPGADGKGQGKRARVRGEAGGQAHRPAGPAAGGGGSPLDDQLRRAAEAGQRAGNEAASPPSTKNRRET